MYDRIEKKKKKTKEKSSDGENVSIRHFYSSQWDQVGINHATESPGQREEKSTTATAAATTTTTAAATTKTTARKECDS